MAEARTALNMTLLLAAAAASWALSFRAGETPTAHSEPTHAGIGYYATDARLSATDDQGRVRYRVTAAAVEQQPRDGSVELQQVIIHYDPPQGRPWDLHSDAGSMPPGGKMVALTGNVVAETRAGDAPPATIRTDYLKFDAASDVVTTNREVHLDQAGSRVRAIGMRADLARERIELLAEVRGSYAP